MVYKNSVKNSVFAHKTFSEAASSSWICSFQLDVFIVLLLSRRRRRILSLALPQNLMKSWGHIIRPCSWIVIALQVFTLWCACLYLYVLMDGAENVLNPRFKKKGLIGPVGRERGGGQLWEVRKKKGETKKEKVKQQASKGTHRHFRCWKLTVQQAGAIFRLSHRPLFWNSEIFRCDTHIHAI